MSKYSNAFYDRQFIQIKKKNTDQTKTESTVSEIGKRLQNQITYFELQRNNRINER